MRRMQVRAAGIPRIHSWEDVNCADIRRVDRNADHLLAIGIVARSVVVDEPSALYAFLELLHRHQIAVLRYRFHFSFHVGGNARTRVEEAV